MTLNVLAMTTPNDPPQLLGIHLIGLTPDNARKLLLSVVFALVVTLILSVARKAFTWLTNSHGRLHRVTDATIPRTAPQELRELPADFWDDAVLVTPGKIPISLRVDSDIPEWFRSQGPEIPEQDECGASRVPAEREEQVEGSVGLKLQTAYHLRHAQVSNVRTNSRTACAWQSTSKLPSAQGKVRPLNVAR